MTNLTLPVLTSVHQPAALLPVQVLRFHRPLSPGLPHELAGGNARRRRPVRIVLVPLPLPTSVRAGCAGPPSPPRGPAGPGPERHRPIPPVREPDRVVANRLARSAAAGGRLPVPGVVPFAQDNSRTVALRSAPEGRRFRRRRRGHRRRELPEPHEPGRLYALPVESRRCGGGQ